MLLLLAGCDFNLPFSVWRCGLRFSTSKKCTLTFFGGYINHVQRPKSDPVTILTFEESHTVPYSGAISTEWHVLHVISHCFAIQVIVLAVARRISFEYYSTAFG